jgi:GT2 family glycosyltransferase
MSDQQEVMRDLTADKYGAPEIELSVIIATYNARALLIDCLESIHRNPPTGSYEIIVVDDASKDGTSEAVKAQFPDVVLLRNEINTHYATANNRAFKIAKGRYLYLLNNDTIVLPEAIEQMLGFLRRHPEAGAVGSKLLNEDGTIQWSVKSLPNAGSALFGARSILTRLFKNNPYSQKHLLHLNRDMSKPFEAGYVSSASIMIPREVINKAGDLDRRLSYHVDADYCKRIADAGYKSYYLPSATIIHLNHRGGTMVSFRRRIRSIVEFHVGSYIYYDKHVQHSRWSPLRIAVVSGLVGRFVLSLAAQATVEAVELTRSFFRRFKP